MSHIYKIRQGSIKVPPVFREPTIREQPFNPEEDAKVLQKAMKGFGEWPGTSYS